MKVLYFDTETTGLSPWKNDVVQIAGIIEIDGKIEDAFEFKCQPHSYENIQQKALDTNGFTIEQLRTFQSPQLVKMLITDIFDKYINKRDKEDKFYPAGQNVQFDIDMMRQFFRKAGDNFWGSYCNYHKIDLLALTTVLKYKGIIDVPNLKLVTIAKYLGIEFDAHDALADIKTTRKCLLILMDKYIKNA